METLLVDGNVKLIDVHDDGSWFCIERAEHDGRMWFKPTGPNSAALCCSARISDADVEGTLDHMVELAKAIRSRSSFSAKRCCVSVKDGRAELFSPRNSRRIASITLDAADDLAQQIDAKAAEMAKESTP